MFITFHKLSGCKISSSTNLFYHLRKRINTLCTVAAAIFINSCLASFGFTQHTHPFLESDGPCTSTDRAIVTCSGDISAGIEIDGEAEADYRNGDHLFYHTLVLTDVDGPITPPSGYRRDGIGFWTIFGNMALQMSPNDWIDIETGGIQAHGIEFGHRSTESVGSIDIDHFGNITTSGVDSNGIKVFGGNADVDLFHVGNIETKTTTRYDRSSNGIFVRQRADDKKIRVENHGNITTEAAFAKGILALAVYESRITLIQRGDITTNYSGNSSSTPAHAIQAISGYAPFFYGSTQAGGDVDVSVIGSILTKGGYSHGIQAWAGVFAGNAGLDVIHVGSIVTLGSNSRAIDGLVHNGTATINHTGTIDSNYLGVYLKISGDEGSGIMNLGQATYDLAGKLVADSTIWGTNWGIYTSTELGNAVSLNFFNDATISGETLDIRGDEGDDSINNYGVLNSPGIINLGAGTNAFNNHVGATFNSGNAVTLYDPTDTEGSGTFTNAGDLSPGGIEEAVLFETWFAEDGSVLRNEIKSNGIQTTTLTGDFVMEETGTYTVTVDASGQSDLLHVTGGTAYLEGNGWVRVHTLDGYAFGTPYTILQSDNFIEGQFEGVRDTAFIDASAQFQNTFELDYDDRTRVNLIITKRAEPCDFAETSNQMAVGCGVIEKLFDDLETLSTSNDIARAVLQLETADEVRDAYDMLTGEVHASLAGILMEASDQRRSLLVQRALYASDEDDGSTYGHSPHGVESYTMAAAQWWSSAYGAQLERDAINSTKVTAAPLTHQSSGFLIGLDHTNDGYTLGIAGGRGTASTEIDNRNSSADTETWSLAAYGTAEFGYSRLLFGAMADWHSIESQRHVIFDTFSESLSADYDATSWQAFVDLDYDLIISNNLSMRPFIRLTHIRLQSDGFTETSSGNNLGEPVSDSVALAADDIEEDLTYILAGLRHGLDLDGFQLQGSIGWRHAFGDIDPALALRPAGSDALGVFSITGSPIAEDVLVAQLAATAHIGNNIHLSTNLGVEVAEDSSAYGANVKVFGRF